MFQPSMPLDSNWPRREGVPALMVSFVNEYSRKLEEVTQERVVAYSKLRLGVNPFTGASTRSKLQKIKALATGLHRVVTFQATDETQSAFLKRPLGIGSANVETNTQSLVRLECDCECFVRSGTICSCTLSIAASKYADRAPHINLDLLLESTAPMHRGPGRPRAVHAGNCFGDGGSAASSSSSPSDSSSSKSSAYYYTTQLSARGALFFHKWRVLVDFDGNNCVGTIVSYRDDYREERRPYTSATPFTRLWKCRFEGDAVDEFEEYEADELGKYMSSAHHAGCQGPAPENQPKNQLMTIPEHTRKS